MLQDLSKAGKERAEIDLRDFHSRQRAVSAYLDPVLARLGVIFVAAVFDDNM